MKFHVPTARNRDESEQIWAGTRQWLSNLGLPTTRRRLAALTLADDDCAHLVQVGAKTPEGERIYVILEASNVDVFYVCTMDHGLMEGFPYPLALGADSHAIDFDEEVMGHA